MDAVAVPAPPLLATKLCAPPIRERAIARPRLQALLDAGSDAALILVSAPAGFGKSTLVAEWVQGRRGAWLTLDAGDNDPGRLLRYLVVALEQAVPTAAAQWAALIGAAEPPAASTVVATVVATVVNGLAQQAGDCYLVLDDYHVLTDAGAQAVIGDLLEHLPSTLHLVIATRADPALPLARLRARGRLVEVRAAELRFTPEEAAAFFDQAMRLRLTPAQVAVLGERAEGWVAGLQLAALSLRGHPDPDTFVHAFAGTNRFILDFLIEEVLAHEPQEVQDFLLRTSVLTRLCGPLCDAVTGCDVVTGRYAGAGGPGGQAMLERLERHNLFLVPLDDERRWYRYHHLFADLLGTRLRQAGDAAGIPALYRRAATWCDENRLPAEAVNYVLRAEDGPLAGDLVARWWGPTAAVGEIETVGAWLAALPVEIVNGSVPLSVACCWVHWLKGEMGAIEPHLVHATAALARAAEVTDSTLPAQVAALRSIVARFHDDFATACTLAEQALALLPPGLPPVVAGQMQGMVTLALASAYDGAGDLERAVSAYAANIRAGRQSGAAVNVAGIAYRLAGALRVLGRLNEAEATCRAALAWVAEAGLGQAPAAGIVHVGLAEVLVERNDLAAAEQHLALASELGRNSGRLDANRNAAAARLRLCLARGDGAGALAAVDAAEAAIPPPVPPLAQAELLSHRARVLLRLGDLEAAAACAQEAVRLVGQDRGQTGEIVRVAALRAQAARAEAGEALPMLSQAIDAAVAAGRKGTAIELYIVRTLIQARSGAGQAAVAGLGCAVLLAESEGYVRLFADEGVALAGLLRELAARPPRPELAPYLARLLAAFPGKAHTAEPTLVEPLTEREVEVLRLLAAGCTNEQIAQRLTVAVGTAKTHVHNVTAKLGAQNRTEAVAKARVAGLV